MASMTLIKYFRFLKKSHFPLPLAGFSFAYWSVCAQTSYVLGASTAHSWFWHAYKVRDMTVGPQFIIWRWWLLIWNTSQIKFSSVTSRSKSKFSAKKIRNIWKCWCPLHYVSLVTVMNNSWYSQTLLKCFWQIIYCHACILWYVRGFNITICTYYLICTCHWSKTNWNVISMI